jgi:hypothetical protein
MNPRSSDAQLRHLLEVDLWRALPGTRLDAAIIHGLAVALAKSAAIHEDGRTAAPGAVALRIHPSTGAGWEAQQLQDTILQAVQVAVGHAGLIFSSPLTVAITLDDAVAAHEPAVVAWHTTAAPTDTKETAIGETAPTEGIETPENAFLIVDGVKVHSLKAAVTNIGRRLDNQLVVDDPRVSRHHAQLRVINGRFVIFDLSSSGGTYVNGQRTSQSILYAGDVISLAGVALVFGQDSPVRQSDAGTTSPSQVSGIDRPTAILKDRSILDRFRKK